MGVSFQVAKGGEVLDARSVVLADMATLPRILQPRRRGRMRLRSGATVVVHEATPSQKPLLGVAGRQAG